MEQREVLGAKPEHPPPQARLHEIRTAENSAAFLLPQLQSLKAYNPSLKILDCGAGSGTISVSFAKLIPDGHVVGIDVNESIVPRARANAETAGISNVKFQYGSIYKLPFDDKTFDVTFCHQVLIHIGDPWGAMREMLRVTKPGGIVAIREGDYDSECVWPELPGLKQFHKLMAGVMASTGGTPTAGRQLLSWALKAGAKQSQVTASYSTTSYHTLEGRATCCKFHYPSLHCCCRFSSINHEINSTNIMRSASRWWVEQESFEFWTCHPGRDGRDGYGVGEVDKYR